jgi:RNA polymerase sigma-70 factor (ECF subfamily)
MNDDSANPLVALLASGEPDAYAEIYDRLAESLFRVARRLLGNPSDAEDAVQDVFVDLVRNRNRLASVRDLDAYLFTMLRHRVGRRLRTSKNERQHLRQLRPPIETPPVTETVDHLMHALQSLPSEQREVIALKIDGGLTFAQIAEVVGIRANTAASRYRYALEKLRRLLEPEP